jgi:DNA primase small subunit
MLTDATLQSGDSQGSNEDIVMVEPESLPSAPNGADDIKEEKKEVKLEDLFADVDSDDEFPSTRPDDDDKEFSSPEMPSSPV